MFKFVDFKLIKAFLVSWILLLSSCVPSSGGASKRTSSGNDVIGGGSTGNIGNGDNNSGSDNQNSVGSSNSLISTLTSSGKQELRHIIDPDDGSYKTKVTIPKDFNGELHLSGLNFSSLSDRLISARFKFGRDRTAVIIPGVIHRVEGKGITPQTEIQLLTLDMSSRPFKDIRLPYDLFDYTDYDTDGDGTEFDSDDDYQEPVSNNNATGLYCRGLKLEDDSTFTITSTDSACDEAGEKCLYAYAKILDSGLYYVNDDGNNVATQITEPAIELGSAGYTGDSESETRSKCLPDTNNKTSIETALQTTMSTTGSEVEYGHTGFSGAYTYNGPYRTANRKEWEISSDALFSDVSVAGTEGTGLFQKSLTSTLTPTSTDVNLLAQAGIKSFLFPRSGRLDLKIGVDYIGFTDLEDPLGNSDANAQRSIITMASGGETDFVDGCNIRKMERDATTGDSISSCNVTATIEIIYTDENGSIITLDSSKELKLQLTRASNENASGKDVIYTALKTCSSNNACGANECCFNERCWSSSLVAQCIDNDAGNAEKAVGETCSSDLECSSLCCTGGACSPHVSNEDAEENEKVLCEKSPGQFCVSKEFCSREFVDTCFLVKKSGGGCEKRCYQVPTFGDCVNGLCRQPVATVDPNVDFDNPNCSLAIDPPIEFNETF